jgi:23S rRNA (adenine2503-C2)-methyltransferase
MGFKRDLTSGEIIDQVLYYARLLSENDESVTNIVVMGMGEPFLNYDNVMKAMNRLNDPQAFGLGARRITISTVGIVPEIRQFADAGTQYNLAISLHTVDNELRSRLIPINRKYPVEMILDACRYYIQKTNRRITFEYALIDDLNDSIKDAESLSHRLKGMLCHVNLIPLNPTDKFAGQPAHGEKVQAFCDVLEANGIPCTVRLRRGIEIGAGCGQLASDELGDHQ